MVQKYIGLINHDHLYYVEGPGDGLGYYANYLYPHLSCDNEKEAIRAAEIANIAYAEGYKKRTSGHT